MPRETNNSTRTSRFLPNTVALAAQTVIATALTLAQVKILSTHLQKDMLGLFASLRGFSLLLAIIAANGLPQLLVRFMPEHEVRGHRDRALKLGIVSLVAASALLILLGGVAYMMRERLFEFARSTEVSGDLLLWFFATTFGVTLKLVVYGGLNGLRRLTYQVVLESLSLLAILICLLIWRNDLNLLRLFQIFGVIHLATLLLAIPLFIAVLTRLPTTSQLAANNEAAPGANAYSTYLFGAVGLSVVAVAFTDVDRYLLAQVLSLEVLALFHIASRISRMASRVLGVANLALQPELTRLDAEDRASRVKGVTEIFLKFSSILAVAMTFGVFILAREIIVFVSSADYLDAMPIVLILSACLPLVTLTAPLTTAMKARDQVRGALLCDLVWASLYVILFFVLGKRFGLLGVGAAYAVACIAQLITAHTISNLAIGRWLVVSVMARLTVAALVAFAPGLILSRYALGDLGVALKIGAWLLGCFAFFRLSRWMAILSSDERSALLEMWRGRGSGFVRHIV